eukprot:scaffold123764_cov66-Phaeocystis_antarctica.AAC.1
MTWCLPMATSMGRRQLRTESTLISLLRKSDLLVGLRDSSTIVTPCVGTANAPLPDVTRPTPAPWPSFCRK